MDQYNYKRDNDGKGETYKLRLRMVDGCMDVRLHDLSENSTIEQIRRHMEIYGDVLFMWYGVTNTTFQDSHQVAA